MLFHYNQYFSKYLNYYTLITVSFKSSVSSPLSISIVSGIVSSNVGPSIYDTSSSVSLTTDTSTVGLIVFVDVFNCSFSISSSCLSSESTCANAVSISVGSSSSFIITLPNCLILGIENKKSVKESWLSYYNILIHVLVISILDVFLAGGELGW